MKSVSRWTSSGRKNSCKMEQNKSIFHSLRDRSCGLGRREDIRRSIIGEVLKCKSLTALKVYLKCYKEI